MGINGPGVNGGEGRGYEPPELTLEQRQEKEKQIIASQQRLLQGLIDQIKNPKMDPKNLTAKQDATSFSTETELQARIDACVLALQVLATPQRLKERSDDGLTKLKNELQKVLNDCISRIRNLDAIKRMLTPAKDEQPVTESDMTNYASGNVVKISRPIIDINSVTYDMFGYAGRFMASPEIAVPAPETRKRKTWQEVLSKLFKRDSTREAPPAPQTLEDIRQQLQARKETLENINLAISTEITARRKTAQTAARKPYSDLHDPMRRSYYGELLTAAEPPGTPET